MCQSYQYIMVHGFRLSKKNVHDFEPKGYQNLETFTSDNPTHDRPFKTLWGKMCYNDNNSRTYIRKHDDILIFGLEFHNNALTKNREFQNPINSSTWCNWWQIKIFTKHHKKSIHILHILNDFFISFIY
jgi:hypothetical protein